MIGNKEEDWRVYDLKSGKTSKSSACASYLYDLSKFNILWSFLSI